MLRRRRLVNIAFGLSCAVLLASGVLGVLAVDSPPGAARTTTVVVRLDKPLQVMEGFGTSERVWSDPHLSQSPRTTVPDSAQQQILSALYRRLGLTRVRVVLDPGIQASRGGPFDFKGKLGVDQLAFVRQAKRYGLRTFFPGPVYLENWMTPADVSGYVDYAMTILRYWRSNGLEPPFYAPLNEPKIAGNFPPSWMHDVVLQLGRRLEAEGFRTKLVIPDDENPVDAYRRAQAVLADPQARRYVGALAYHIYRGGEADWSRFHELAARYGLPVWMTEWSGKGMTRWPEAGQWATTIHTLIAMGGVSAIDYLWGFFGDWTPSYIPIRFERGVYQSHSLSPDYYITGQWSRFVRPGYRRVAATQQAGSVLTTAFVGPKKKLVTVMINVSRSPQSVRVAVRGGRVVGKIAGTRTSPTENWRVLAPIRARGGGFSAVLAPSSVTTLVAQRR